MTPFSARSAALNEAKQANGVARSAKPDEVIKVGSDKGKAAKLDQRNVRQYEHTNSEGKKISVREDKAAKYGDGGKGDQTPHFNAGEQGTDLKQLHYFPE